MLAWDKAHRQPVYWVSGARHRDGAILIQALMWNCRNLAPRCEGRMPSAITQGREYRCEARGADRSVVAMMDL
jgi:hypothetical protein